MEERRGADIDQTLLEGSVGGKGRWEGLDQPSFPAHAVELPPLCDEVGRGVRLRDEALVHHDHPAEQRQNNTLEKRFRPKALSEQMSIK